MNASIRSRPQAMHPSQAPFPARSRPSTTIDHNSSCRPTRSMAGSQQQPDPPPSEHTAGGRQNGGVAACRRQQGRVDPFACGAATLHLARTLLQNFCYSKLAAISFAVTIGQPFGGVMLVPPILRSSLARSSAPRSCRWVRTAVVNRPTGRGNEGDEERHDPQQDHPHLRYIPVTVAQRDVGGQHQNQPHPRAAGGSIHDGRPVTSLRSARARCG